MAINKALIEERVKALVKDLLAEEAAEGLNEHENINDIEDGMVRIGDMVAREFGQQKLAAHMSRPSKDPPPCPDCGHAGEHQGERPRNVITRRGEVSLTEAKYRCPKCRRLFFPSDQGART